MLSKNVIGREELKLNIEKGYNNYKYYSKDVLRNHYYIHRCWK